MAWHELSAFTTASELSGFCLGAQVAHITHTYNFNVIWGGALGWASIRCCEQQQKPLVHRGWNSDNMVVADQGSSSLACYFVKSVNCDLSDVVKNSIQKLRAG